MKSLYLQCNMGAAGDMLTAALLELLPDKEAFTERLNALGVPHIRFTAERAEKCGVTGTHMRVEIDGKEEHAHEHGHHHHEYSTLHGIGHIVEHLNASDKVKADILAVYQLIAEAESRVHGEPVTEIHFHEVGALDAVADVAAVCLLMEEIHPTEVVASPINVGSGSVKCAHGILPVPAPATALLLKDMPVYSNEIDGELCTPTGAALLRFFVNRFGSVPTMRVSNIGYGMGRKDFPQANCVRAFLGTREDSVDTATELTCNVDDMTGEDIGFALERLLEAGARDAFAQPVTMKKSRPGMLLTVLCSDSDKEKMTALLFRHTTTLGVRESLLSRHILERETQTVSTSLGEVRVKISRGYGVEKRKAEYDDLARIAREQGLTLAEVRAKAEKEING